MHDLSECVLRANECEGICVEADSEDWKIWTWALCLRSSSCIYILANLPVALHGCLKRLSPGSQPMPWALAPVLWHFFFPASLEGRRVLAGVLSAIELVHNQFPNC